MLGVFGHSLIMEIRFFNQPWKIRSFFKTVLGGNVLIFKYCLYKENVQDMKTVHVLYFCSVEIVQR
jgi:hypothetical protein